MSGIVSQALLASSSYLPVYSLPVASAAVMVPDLFL